MIKLSPAILLVTSWKAFPTRGSFISIPVVPHRNTFSSKCPLLSKNVFQITSKSDDDDDDTENPLPELGDWRNFRNSLLQTGLNTMEEDGKNDESSIGKSTHTLDEKSTIKKQRKIVSKLNEELLQSQNSKLAEEYMSGVWCHKVGRSEVGGLVLRMPLEFELHHHESSRLGQSLKERLKLSSDDTGREIDEPYIESYSPSIKDGNTSLDNISSAAKTAYWYKGAQEMIKSEMETIFKKGSENNGRIDPATLSNHELELLEQYLHCQETWQEVCLVIEKDDEKGTASTIVINRPLATKLNVDLASMVLFGQWSDEAISNSNSIVEFLDAFSEACAIYIGGPDMHGEPAMIIHGIAGLAGAEEIAPGTEIYKGGLEAAIQGIKLGKYSPLEFRFFVGKYVYSENELDTRVDIGQYQPLACARSVALKQCIQLPKPLWHEVMELAGGELRDISALELLKRDDIQIDE